ncbi:MAG: UDP-N-acetylglucosamine 1-carboxyvinyltransferase [Alphaproteobacteria bacterium]|nr:UDP-N-acetylglucosamine 1-carboxyvinyltransferase [Alphaproteobacteria bacterium]MDE2337215.1 UDP-N-acetylglucosamine 1-carboxyvinyltransferase [Alphaproteobacteria bacterium]
MDKIRITGGQPLNGEIEISGAKNAALPLMAAALLTDQPLQFGRVPDLRDVASLVEILEELGVSCAYDPQKKTLKLHAAQLTGCIAPYDLVRKMRASILVLGPLVARHGEAKVSLPGGCAIGTRPVDMHIDALRELGAEIELVEGYIHARAPQGLTGAEIHFPKSSVGATENVMMAAALAKGTTVLHNAAREPEIVDLGRCLVKMGAEIEGLGTDKITVRGKSFLRGTAHAVIADRIEAGTFAIAGAMTGGALILKNAELDHLGAMIDPLYKAGVDMEAVAGGVAVRRVNDVLRGVDIMTEPYPGFPTDLQAQMMSMLTVAAGAGMVTETIFENRFMHVPELMRMGADITVHGASALVRGVKKLKGADVMATDLRASVSLVLAGLVAEGATSVHRIYHLERGYENIVGKLKGVGAKLEKLKDDSED